MTVVLAPWVPRQARYFSFPALAFLVRFDALSPFFTCTRICATLRQCKGSGEPIPERCLNPLIFLCHFRGFFLVPGTREHGQYRTSAQVGPISFPRPRHLKSVFYLVVSGNVGPIIFFLAAHRIQLWPPKGGAQPKHAILAGFSSSWCTLKSLNLKHSSG